MTLTKEQKEVSKKLLKAVTDFKDKVCNIDINCVDCPFNVKTGSCIKVIDFGIIINKLEHKLKVCKECGREL